MIENCVLGLASADERSEFDRMCAAHSEVRAARERFELSLERELQDRAVAPPINLKSKIFAEIEIENDSLENNNVINIRKAPVVRTGWLRAVSAAAVILLVGSTILNFYF